ncbi:MAG: nuclear transport factor 2 family protein [Chloroflexia bacterium]|nr:nuclear transport factor 2 family protein [Chloroflexia bacterium]
MRRFNLLLSVVVMLLLGPVSLGASMVVHAQDASPAARAGEIPPLLMAWAEAWSSGDPAQVMTFYTDDAVYEEIPTGIVAQGPEEIQAFIENTYAMFSGVQVIPRTGFQAKKWAVLESDFVGKDAGGVSFSVPFVSVFELEGDKIVRTTDYFDLYDFMGQLGMLPPAEEATPMAGTPTP